MYKRQELQENDILYVFGPFEKVNQFAKEQNLELTDTHVSEYVEGAEVEKLSVREIGIAEVLLMPDSKLINKMCIRDSAYVAPHGTPHHHKRYGRPPRCRSGRAASPGHITRTKREATCDW